MKSDETEDEIRRDGREFYQGREKVFEGFREEICIIELYVVNLQARTESTHYLLTLLTRTTMTKYVCDVCGWEYDPEVGVPEAGIAPGTPWEDVPEDFECPMCSVGKDQFSAE